MRLFLDLDGTLIGPSGAVSDAVWNGLERARSQGVKLSVCTGRPRAGIAQTVAQRVDPEGPHIFENGAWIGPSSAPPLRLEALEPFEVQALIAHCEKTQAVLELYTPEGIFVSAENEDCQTHARALDIEVTRADLHEIAQRHRVGRAHWIMRPEWVEMTLSVELNHSEVGVASSPVLPEMVFASITRRGVSKGTAAQWLCESQGEALDQTAGIGDAPGDRPLLDRVEHPFVMQNSPPEMRADYPVVASVEDDGVLEAIDAILSKRCHPIP